MRGDSNELIARGKKTCSKCLEIKDLDMFGHASEKGQYRSDGRQSACRTCDRTRNREAWRRKHGTA